MDHPHNLPGNGVGGSMGSHEGHSDSVPDYGAGIADAPQTCGNGAAEVAQLLQMGSAPTGGIYPTPSVR